MDFAAFAEMPEPLDMEEGEYADRLERHDDLRGRERGIEDPRIRRDGRPAGKRGAIIKDTMTVRNCQIQG